MEQICEQVMVTCPEGCGEKHLRGKVTAVMALLDDQIACILCYKGVDQDQVIACYVAHVVKAHFMLMDIRYHN